MDNKDLVLNVLKGTNQNTQTPDFLKYFDSIYTYYSQHKKNNFKNLTEMNKAIIDECYSWINNKSSGKNEEKKKIKLETVDLDNLRQKKDGQFELKLKKREKQFSSLINKPAPTKIDFSMNSSDFPVNNNNNDDNFPTEDLTRLLNQSMEDRELDLQQLQNTKPSAEALKWLNQEETNKSDNIIQINNEPSTAVTNKKVTFQDELSVKSILSNIKNNNVTDNVTDNNIDKNVLNILSKILENQEKIIKLISEK